MPPKSKSSKKGRKLTKAQKAKLQQEEEERRLREEEEARLQAEREEQERLERERKEKEVERLELKDQQRRQDELNELRHLLEQNHTAVTKWKTDALETAKWERYMRCDGAPDPAVQQDINTYISLWRDDPEVNVTAVLKQCNLALQLVDEVEGLFKDATDPQENQQYKEALINLQELIHFKHHLTTEDILKRASSNIDTETGNMQTVIRDDQVTVCLWANIKKNPRFKGLNFEEVGFGFEIPKQLAVSDVAVRILHTHYDHLSMLARMTHLRIQTASRRSLAGGEEVPEDSVEQVETKENGKVEEEPQQQRVEEEVQSIQGLEGRKSATSLQSRKNSPLAEVQESNIQTQMEALEAEGDLIGSSVQLPLMNQAVHVVDLIQFTPLGGVFYYDVFHLPPQALQVNGWEIRQFLNAGLQTFHYPTEKFDFGSSDALICPPIGASVILPDFVVFLETPQVARWDAAEKQWRMDGITDVSYDEAEAKISFKMDSFQAFVLMQKTYANLPFQSWELRPLGQDAAIFMVNGALIDLSITIQDNQCLLQSERDRGLSHIVGKWMNVSALQKAMINAGVNIFVNQYTDNYVSTCGKDPLTEHAAYEQMALFASACAFSWSKWNSKCGAEHLVMQACEHLDSAPVPEDSWSLYLLGAQRSQKLEITEESEDFSSDHHPSSEFHSTFIHMLQDSMSPGGVARTRESHHLFVDTVQSLLCATRPLMYS
ncbi:dynein axonemal intermediate chain 7 [Acanthochromis polyacanthus]|uniref:dynein axonemal intermediate chain 7 n=1 Tax=Acanthochromis polyacanthus TaxID=80966 RepID=UPI002234AC21|nr:dynein axonemal intermediate chain 7 [Acanthochromis polyacanthus]